MWLTWQHALTWANALTLIRSALALPCACFAAEGNWLWAAWLLSIAVLTDLLDGPLARRLNQATAFGALADHATDAAFVTLLLAALAWRGEVTWLLPPLIVIAFVQYAVDSRALTGRALRASWLGRVNGISYFVLAAVVVYRNALHLSSPSAQLIGVLSWLLVASTVVSMVDRLRAPRLGE